MLFIAQKSHGSCSRVALLWPLYKKQSRLRRCADSELEAVFLTKSTSTRTFVISAPCAPNLSVLSAGFKLDLLQRRNSRPAMPATAANYGTKTRPLKYSVSASKSHQCNRHYKMNRAKTVSTKTITCRSGTPCVKKTRKTNSYPNEISTGEGHRSRTLFSGGKVSNVNIKVPRPRKNTGGVLISLSWAVEPV